MTPINFTPADSDLTLWSKEESPLFGATKDGSSPKTLLQQPFLIPWAVAGLSVALSWIFPFLNNRSAIFQISNLEFEHAQFLQLSARISSAQQTFDQQKSDIRDFSALFTSAAHAYPFTFNLQRSIPAQVSLSSFVLDNSQFNVCSFGPNYESLEDLIDLLKAMPAVDPNSVRFTNIASDPSALGSTSSCQSLSPLQPVSAFVVGVFQRSSPSDLQEIYSAASDYGQFHKLRLYNSLLQEIGGLD
jgi:hypothetical protein